MWDSSRQLGDFKVGQYVLVHRTAPNKLLPHFTGPYIIESVSADLNFVTAAHYNAPDSKMGPVHVSRLLHFDASRMARAEMVAHQADEGSFVVDGVIEHRVIVDGSLKFHIRWSGNPITSWEPSRNVKSIIKVQEYCTSHGLPVLRVPATALASTRASAPGRGVDSSVPLPITAAIPASRPVRAGRRHRK